MGVPPVYRPTIGLEIHAELKTRTKMFCNSKNDPEEEKPNVNVCPICLAHPGTLPTINKEAIRHVLRVGTAVNGTLADYSEFDRKSYFYPDIPKGYQISQYEHPLVTGGELNGVAITRVHLEEDTARSTHAGGTSLVDFNRAGIPLMELVTEPVIHDAKTAGDFARALQLLLRTLGASDANLEKGEMRIEANVSVSKTGAPSADYVEVKNINSFRSVERAIAYEIERQTALLENGERVVKATRGWNEGKQETFHQRFKEGSADYRYFPEPDLPKLILSEHQEFSYETLRASLPELPDARRERYTRTFNIPETTAAQLANSLELSLLVDEALTHLEHTEDAALMANIIISDVVGAMRAQATAAYAFTASELAELVNMFSRKEISSRGMKDTLSILVAKGGSPKEVAEREGFLQVSDTGALQEAVGRVLKENAGVADEYKGGKESVLQFLVGQAMKETKGAGNPGVIRELLIEQLAK